MASSASQRFTLVAAEGHDLREQWNPDGKGAFLFRLEHDRKRALLSGCHDLLPMCGLPVI
jgi:hypothetical protein